MSFQVLHLNKKNSSSILSLYQYLTFSLIHSTYYVGGSLMVSALISWSSGLGSSPGQGHCISFLSKASFHPGALMGPGKLDTRSNPLMGSRIHLVASLYRNWNKLWPDGPLTLYADFTFFSLFMVHFKKHITVNLCYKRISHCHKWYTVLCKSNESEIRWISLLFGTFRWNLTNFQTKRYVKEILVKNSSYYCSFSEQIFRHAMKSCSGCNEFWTKFQGT